MHGKQETKWPIPGDARKIAWLQSSADGTQGERQNERKNIQIGERRRRWGKKKETANDSVLNWIAAPTHDCLTKGKSYIQVVGFIRLAAIAT